MGVNTIAPAAGNTILLCAPVSANQQYSISYDAAGQTNRFRFVYAKGSK